MAADLHAHRVTALAITPGFLCSEAVLDTFGVTEANWRDAIEKDPYFAESETPCLLGRAVAALAADPNVGLMGNAGGHSEFHQHVHETAVDSRTGEGASGTGVHVPAPPD